MDTNDQILYDDHWHYLISHNFLGKIFNFNRTPMLNSYGYGPIFRLVTRSRHLIKDLHFLGWMQF